MQSEELCTIFKEQVKGIISTNRSLTHRVTEKDDLGQRVPASTHGTLGKGDCRAPICVRETGETIATMRTRSEDSKPKTSNQAMESSGFKWDYNKKSMDERVPTISTPPVPSTLATQRGQKRQFRSVPNVALSAMASVPTPPIPSAVSTLANMRYCPTDKGWQVEWTEAGVRKWKNFLVQQFFDFEKAMRAAWIFRSILVMQGLIDESQAGHRAHPSRGVDWDAGKQSWIVGHPNTGGSQQLAARFKPLDLRAPEIAKARLVATDQRKVLELGRADCRAAARNSGARKGCTGGTSVQTGAARKENSREEGSRKTRAPRTGPQTKQQKKGIRRSGVAGVYWDRFRKRWKVQWRDGKKQNTKSIVAKDDSPAEIERARQSALELLHTIKGPVPGTGLVAHGRCKRSKG